MSPEKQNGSGGESRAEKQNEVDANNYQSGVVNSSDFAEYYSYLNQLVDSKMGDKSGYIDESGHIWRNTVEDSEIWLQSQGQEQYAKLTADDYAKFLANESMAPDRRNL